jgi:hypothetical protein
MNDMRPVIVPKSDQINADDLLGGPRTITIERVVIKPGTEQPVSIFYEGDNGRPYRPCKSMAKVMVHAWGPDANEYVGRSMTLYCDPKVKWGGMEVGGIRVSHMSHIDGRLVMALTETKGRKQPFVVQLLKQPQAQPQAPQQQAPQQKPRASVGDWVKGTLPDLLGACTTAAQVEALTAGKVYQAAGGRASEEEAGEMRRLVDSAIARVSLPPADTDPFADDDAFPGDLPSREAA